MYDLSVKPDSAGRFRLAHEENPVSLVLRDSSQASAVVEINGVTRRVPFHFDGDSLSLLWHGVPYQLKSCLHDPQQGADAAGSGQIRAPMDGAVVDLLCESGQSVSKGDTLAVVEAMKMEHPLKADRDGVVGQIHVALGDQVKTRHLMIEISEPESA